ncbi:MULTISPECIES: hypothetical protein [unclassified Burkholderia]|uniref:hypothetical protein n=1 Tax=unclassified Burkholderia TaxID=2613784 RepID=UPI001E3E9D8E|nr:MULTISPECIES: hypothetical protein [unclassified Burkholderia]UEP32328.1 hypothetical protein LMA01_24445 [Burkholderia sp. B21-007]UEP45778.1 hypothetical protein LMA02_20335 [Burkholderia sp. B21-005]
MPSDLQPHVFHFLIFVDSATGTRSAKAGLLQLAERRQRNTVPAPNAKRLPSLKTPRATHRQTPRRFAAAPRLPLNISRHESARL